MPNIKCKLINIATGMWQEFAELCKGIFIWPRNNNTSNMHRSAMNRNKNYAFQLKRQR
jgi:hypothetical protein